MLYVVLFSLFTIISCCNKGTSSDIKDQEPTPGSSWSGVYFEPSDIKANPSKFHEEAPDCDAGWFYPSSGDKDIIWTSNNDCVPGGIEGGHQVNVPDPLNRSNIHSGPIFKGDAKGHIRLRLSEFGSDWKLLLSFRGAYKGGKGLPPVSRDSGPVALLRLVCEDPLRRGNGGPTAPFYYIRNQSQYVSPTSTIAVLPGTDSWTEMSLSLAVYSSTNFGCPNPWIQFAGYSPDMWSFSGLEVTVTYQDQN